MSRSFKKTPITKCAGYGTYGKKLANRKIRHTQGDVLFNRKLYRKAFDTWDIYDCKSRMTRKDAKNCGMIDIWEKFYHRK
ncbi:MAG: hypothetical protein HFH35_15355 [Eubacterium sp.]|nr:hypothetical protein [Eubacterium sp.]